MDKQKTNYWHVLQVAVFLIMAALALSCGSSKNSSRSTGQDLGNAMKMFSAGLEGGQCGGAGFVMSGTASSESSCSSLCGRKGYSKYCFSSSSGACFCK